MFPALGGFTSGPSQDAGGKIVWEFDKRPYTDVKQVRLIKCGPRTPAAPDWPAHRRLRCADALRQLLLALSGVESMRALPFPARTSEGIFAQRFA